LADPALWISQVHPGDWDRVLAEIEASFATLTPLVDEIRMQSRSGALVWFHTEAKPVPDPSGRTLYLQGILMDITARGRRTLRRARQLWRKGVSCPVSLKTRRISIVITIQYHPGQRAKGGPCLCHPLVGKKCYEVFHEADEPCAICPHAPLTRQS
jgi:hypothetical protein